MNLLTPTALTLSLLLPLIVLMYLLKLRRQEQDVSSTYLWQRLVRDVEANAPWQRLRANLLMFLQLLFLIALIIAIAQPFFWAENISGNALILIVDTSASMAATDVEPSRLEAAKAQAQSFVNQATEETRITVITAGHQTQVQVASSQDRRLVLQAINDIEVSMSESDLSTALQLSSAIASRQPDTQTIILSDGRVTLPQRLNLNGFLSYYPIGIGDNNQGISAISFQQNPSGDNGTVFAQITNYSMEDVTRRVELYADGNLIDAAEIPLSPGSQAVYLQDSVPAEIESIRVQLSGQDAFELDDQAWAVSSLSEPVNVLMVSEGNRFLEVSLSLLPNISLASTTPAEYTLSPDQTADITIFDNFTPQDETLPAGSILFIAPPESTNLFTLTGILEQPSPRAVDITDPILENIAISSINIFEANHYAQPDWARVIVTGDSTADNGPLLFYGSPDGQRVAVLAFQLQNSDLPLQVAFPLLTANLLNWLAPNQGVITTAAENTFATLNVSLPLEAATVTITPPEGRSFQTNTENPGHLTLEGVPPGIYEIHWGDEASTQTVVNFFSPAESQIQPADNLALLTGSAAENTETVQPAKQIIWRPFAITALVLLLLEWFIYHRATLSRLWQTARLPKREVL